MENLNLDEGKLDPTEKHMFLNSSLKVGINRGSRIIELPKLDIQELEGSQ